MMDPKIIGPTPRVILGDALHDCTIAKVEYVLDEHAELYFKAADVLILPYTHIVH